MGMRRFFAAGTVAATVLTLAGAGSIPARAAPAISWWSDDFDEDQDVCVSRAQNAFTREGWTNIKTGGNAGRSVYADKDRLSGLVLCLGGSVIVVVTGGDGDLAPNGCDRLEYYMKD